MNQSTGSAPDRQSSTAPALAYTNPQPRLPSAEASPPTQPETFIRRARRVQTGSCTLKIWYLALCTFGRAWVRDTDRVKIRIKRQTLAGELECRLNTIRDRLADLRAAGLIETRRSRYHLEITVFCEPQPELLERTESAPSESAQTGRKAPLLVESQTGRKAPPQTGRKAPPPMSSGSLHQEEEEQPLQPTKKQYEAIEFLWTRLERSEAVPKPTTRARAALLIEELSGERQNRTRNHNPRHTHRRDQRYSNGNLTVTHESILDDWVPATSPDADPAAVTDWRCDVEQAARRGMLKIQQSVYIDQGLAAGVIDPKTEIDAILSGEDQ